MKRSITLTGVTIGTVCAAIAALFAVIFHKSLSPEIVAFLPVVVGAIAHAIGVNFATTRAMKKAALANK